MTLFSLQALSWGTVVGAVTSALLLGAREPAGLEFKPSRPPAVQPSSIQAAPTARRVGGLVQPHAQQAQLIAPL